MYISQEFLESEPELFQFTVVFVTKYMAMVHFECLAVADELVQIFYSCIWYFRFVGATRPSEIWGNNSRKSACQRQRWWEAINIILELQPHLG